MKILFKLNLIIALIIIQTTTTNEPFQFALFVGVAATFILLLIDICKQIDQN